MVGTGKCNPWYLRSACARGKSISAHQLCVGEQGDPGHPGKESDFDEAYFFKPYSAKLMPAAA